MVMLKKALENIGIYTVRALCQNQDRRYADIESEKLFIEKLNCAINNGELECLGTDGLGERYVDIMKVFEWYLKMLQ